MGTERYVQIAMNCGSFTGHENNDISQESCVMCANYDVRRHGCSLELDEKIYDSLTQYYQDFLED